ncbi:MAG: ABC transporter substrate-binding protein/permease [Lentisphaeria bacterium]|nr:ABC transporter substrate-binding protein/permease [Lentisphaeria bacterium]
MKIITNLILLLSVIFFCSCGKEDKPKLTMVTEATFPPYEFRTGNKIDGIDPAIIRHITAKLGYELEIQDMSFDSVITAVQSGKADVAASGITVTEDRKKQVNFTLPYVIAKQVIIVKNDSRIKSASDLKKYTVGVQHGTTGDLYVTKNIKEPQRFTNGALAVTALASGKLDAVVIDGEPAEVYVSQRQGLKILPEPLTFEEYAFAISKKNVKLLEDFNRVLKEMKETGILDSIIKKYKDKNSEEAKNKAGTRKETILQSIKDSFVQNFVKDKRYLYLWKGFLITVEISFFAVLMGLVIGFVVALIRSTAIQTGKYKFADFLCRTYLTVIRGTPVVVQLLIIYFVIFGSVDIDKVLVAVIAFGINSGAYVAEIFRAGIMSIDKGQMEAGRSLGLSYFQTMREIILPQAFKNVLPALGNEFIVLLKETSVSGYIALQDLTKGGDIIRSQTYDAFFPLIAVALIYLAVVMFLSTLMGKLERRLKENE